MKRAERLNRELIKFNEAVQDAFHASNPAETNEALDRAAVSSAEITRLLAAQNPSVSLAA